MSDKTIFAPKAWNQYNKLQDEDKKLLKKVNQIIKDIQRNGNEGIGKPEMLRNNLSGWWSRELDKKNRIVYRITEDGDIEILQCIGHYSDK